MRRKDREVIDDNRLDEIINSCDCCRLGFCDKGEVYIVPMNFGYVHEGNKRIFYFHCAEEGRKLELAAKNPSVGFELDTGHELKTAEEACGYTFNFQSIIGTGTIRIVDEFEEKIKAFKYIMAHYSEREDFKFPEAMVNMVRIMKLDVEKISGKEHV